MVKSVTFIGKKSRAQQSMPAAKTATVTRRGPKTSESQPPKGRRRLDAKMNGMVRCAASSRDNP